MFEIGQKVKVVFDPPMSEWAKKYIGHIGFVEARSRIKGKPVHHITGTKPNHWFTTHHLVPVDDSFDKGSWEEIEKLLGFDMRREVVRVEKGVQK
jgi:hypothetical protein